jgi:hypothetical protein
MFEFLLQVAQYDNTWVKNTYKHHDHNYEMFIRQVIMNQVNSSYTPFIILHVM